MTRLCRWLSAMIGVLAVLAGPAALVPAPPPCPKCVDHCPMHAERAGCHENARHSCHDRPGAAFVGHACEHGASHATAPAWRGILPTSAERHLPTAFSAVAIRDASPGASALLEPPTDPPRPTSAVS